MTILPDPHDKKCYKAADEILGKNGKAAKIIEQYFKDARETGELPKMEDAVKQIEDRIMSACDEVAKSYELTNDQQLWLKAECSTTSFDAESAYRKYCDQYHPKTTGKEPYHVDDSDKKTVKPILKNVEAYVSSAVSQLLNRCAKQGICPNKWQFDAYVEGQYTKAKKFYTKDSALTSAQEQWLDHEFESYKPELQNQYKAYAGHVKITNTMPEGDNNPVAAVNAGTGTVITNDGTVIQAESEPETKESNLPLPPKAPMTSIWAKTNVSFSGCDMVVSASMRSTDGRTVSVVMGSLQTVSYSIYRKLSPINCIGNVNAKDYVGGPRTVAGSLVFTVFHQHWATDLLDKFYEAEKYAANRKVLMDEVAPIDLTISMANEYGVKSRLAIYSVRLFSEGQVMSINDIYTENTYQYVALNVDYLSNIETVNDIWTPFTQQLAEYDKKKAALEAEAKVKPPTDSGVRTIQSAPEPEPEQEQEEPGQGTGVWTCGYPTTGRTEPGPAPAEKEQEDKGDGHTKEPTGESTGVQKEPEPESQKSKTAPKYGTIINVPNDLIKNECINLHANGMTLMACIAEIGRQANEAKKNGKNLLIVRRCYTTATAWAKKLAYDTVNNQEEG